MNTVSVQVDLSGFGISEQFSIDVPETVEGVTYKDGDTFKPRNNKEALAIEKIAGQIAGSKLADNPAVIAQLEQDQRMINDPIKEIINQQKIKANQPGAPGLGAAVGEVIQGIVPGGNEFQADTFVEGIKNTGAKILPGSDPKQVASDAVVIGADMALASQMINQAPLWQQRNLKNAILSTLRKNPVAGAATMIGTNIAAKGIGNEAYDLINDMTRQIMGLPDPSAAYQNDEAIRNLIDQRNELLWSGGAVGLSRVWPHMKKFFGKSLFGVEKGMKVSGGIDAAGNPVMVDVMDQAKKLNVPMNVFSTSKAGFVNAAGKVIGLFPFVATRARQAQNAQQIAVASQINNVLNDLSPVSLFADSGVLAMKEFKNMVSRFAASKAVLYKRANNLADKVGDEFIPLQRLKDEARALEYATYGPKGKQAGAGTLGVNVPHEYNLSKLDDILGPFTGKARSYTDALINLQYINKEFITGRQFADLQAELNAMKRAAAGDAALGPDIGGVENFTKAMIETLNDFGSFKQFDEASGKNQLVKEFAGAMDLANQYFFNNVNFTKGRTGQILALADQNIMKAFADENPGMLTGDMVAKILMNDASSMAPLAIKEMKVAMGDDAMKAVARSYLDDQIRGTTRYISGTIRTKGEPTAFGQVKSFLSGKEAEATQKTAQFNIPILDVERLQDVFGLTNPNKTASMIEIFGKEQHDKLRNVVALANEIQQTSFGNVSEFVKRRGFLGGVSAVTNLAFGGLIASNPFGHLGYVLAARYGMSKMADPKFLDGLTTLMNPELSDLAKRQALITLGRMSGGDTFGVETENIPEEIRSNYDPSNPVDVMKLMLFAGKNEANVAYPGIETMEIEIGEDGFATGVNITKAESQPEFSQDGQRVGEKFAIENMQEQDMASAATPDVNPFLNVDFNNMNEAIAATGVGMGADAPTNLNDAQRVALAGGDLDEAIALGNRRV